ncbi:MAG: hypothetical protein AAB925_01810 [Patescibacteria group bacterium]
MPAIKIKIWKIIPIIIKTTLHTAPRIREKKLEIKVLKNSTMSKPLEYLHLYLLHGEKSVLKSKEIEK